MINILDDETINQIAAGEVVDRPSSIVKELMENSIDAGATSVTVDIKDGGLSMIRVTDNGRGILKDDVRLAFLRHATSKIADAKDILTVSSLGFRGEALASIAAVSKVELLTKVSDSLMGSRYLTYGGNEVCFEDAGVPDGTTIIVKDLFFNTPARRKFMKSQTTEAGYISDICEKIALSHPGISIRLIVNGTNKLHTVGNGKIKDTIYRVFGKDITNNLREINFVSELVSVKGFVGLPGISRGNRNYEIYFVNGRYIKNNAVCDAIEEGYEGFLMMHKFPFVVLYIEVEPELVDVNVHPSKMEMRFKDGEHIYPLLVSSVREGIMQKDLIVKSSTDKLTEKAIKPVTDYKIPEVFETKRTIETVNETANYGEKDVDSEFDLVLNADEEIDVKESVTEENITEEDVTEDITVEEDIAKEKTFESEPVKKAKQDTLFKGEFLSEKAKRYYKVIGQAFATYWIIEYEDNLYIMDQHAAHEKINYEHFMQRYNEHNITKQLITPPIVISLSATKEDALNKHMDEILDLGYEIEHYGNNDYIIRAVPYDIPKDVDRKSLLIDIFDSIEEYSDKLDVSAFAAKVASMSCKAAIKGNQVVDEKEVIHIMDELMDLDNPFNCPHGRPTLISISKQEMDRKFKRIVN